MANDFPPPIEQPLDIGSQRSISAVNWFADHGYPVRTSSRVVPLVGGEAAFSAVATALRSATKSINMAFWGLDPATLLVRGTASSYDKQNILAEILVSKALSGVKVNVVVWDHPTAFIGSGSDGGSAIVEQNNSLNLGRFFAASAVIPNLTVKMTNSHSSIPGSGSFHQKFIVIDVESPAQSTAFVMGHNMMPNYWDTTALTPRSSRREFYLTLNGNTHLDNLAKLQRIDETLSRYDEMVANGTAQEQWAPRVEALREEAENLRQTPHSSLFSYSTQTHHDMNPFLDVSTQVYGGAVADIYHSFERIWKLNGGTLAPTHGELQQSSFIASGSRGTSQLAATFSAFHEKSIRNHYLNAISKANKYVFILDQYFRDRTLTDEIIAAYKKRGIIGRKAIPFVVISNSWEGQFAQEGHDTLILGKFSAADIPVHYCRMVTQIGAGRKDIYIHAKVLIVDDVFYTIGSANYNERSMNSDPELNIGVVHPEKAEQLRRDLWNICIGSPINEIMQDPDTGAKRWLEKLGENDELYTEGASLKNGTSITFKPTGWRGIWPTKWAAAPSSTTSEFA